MKKIIVIIPLFLFCSAWASEKCKTTAQELVDVREDYKSLAAIRGDVAIRRAGLSALSGERYAIENNQIRNLELSGQIVFNHMGGAKGDKLYKRAYAECVAEEKEIADRQAKQEARAKASTLKKPEVIANLSEPSARYADRIRLRLRANIALTQALQDDVKDAPNVEFEIRSSPDGTIISRKLLSSSGNNAWDDVVLNAIDKISTLPRDEDGLVPSSFKMSFRPRD